jgi:aminopeptidase N
VQLVPDLQRFTFQGTCIIQFRIDSTTLNDTNRNVITLHAKELCIASAQYVVVLDDTSSDNNKTGVTPSSPVNASEILFNVKATTVQFTFEQGIPSTAQTILVTIQYMGYLNNQMAGFYRSEYTNMEGQKRIMASTQFESLDARRCFPCIDEPGVKAIFAVQLTVDTTYDVLSNMPIACKQMISSTTKVVTFLDTPIMSTYLVAICVGEFDVVQTTTTHGVMVSVYTPPGKSQMGTYALNTASRALSAYDDFFQVPYPLPKLDMIAIPEFAMGAMEVRLFNSVYLVGAQEHFRFLIITTCNFDANQLVHSSPLDFL